MCFDAESSNYPMKEEIPLSRLFRNEKIGIPFAIFRVGYFFLLSSAYADVCTIYAHVAQNARSRY